MKQAIRHQAPTLRHPRKTGIALALGALALGSTFGTAAQAASTAPLVQQSDVTYLGAFALPPGMYGSSSFDYGGHGLAPYRDPSTGKRTLFMEGHAQRPGNVAQVEIPASFVKSSNWSSLPVAKVMQNFSDITDGKLGSVDPSNPNNPTFIYGMLPYNGRLITSATNIYSPSQAVSHGVSGFNLSVGNDFKGFYPFATNVTAPPRALGGPMTPIPPEWQAAFGGQAFTGLYGVSIVSTTSAGPSLTVFNPDSVGTANPIPGKTVLYYPLSNPVCGAVNCEATQNDIYNLSTGYGGMAFPPGSRTVLFVEAHGTGPYCYNTAQACNDPAMPDVKGPHAPPYRYQILAYDANDILAVKNGTKQTWEPKPYGIWPLNDMPNSGNAFIKGAGYDPETGQLYIAQDYGTQARIEVYQIKSAGTGTVGQTTLSPPTNLRIK